MNKYWPMSFKRNTMFGEEEWTDIQGRYHRVDGPAIVFNNDEKAWFLKGEQYSFKEYVSKRFPEDSAEKTMFLLKWGPYEK